MKKISFKNLNLDEVEQLSREQLKNILGGFGSGSGSGGGSVGSEILEVRCATSCVGWNGTSTVTGTCTKSTVSGGLQMCFCSVTAISGSGNDCYA